jgi:hypothetical protein
LTQKKDPSIYTVRPGAVAFVVDGLAVLVVLFNFRRTLPGAWHKKNMLSLFRPAEIEDWLPNVKSVTYRWYLLQ